MPDCFLHLNSLSVLHAGGIVSTKAAPGLILATGNEGEFLRKDVINTYMSNDGGISWRMLAKGNHLYDIGDQGGLIVLVPNGEPSKHILFSWDMGRSFTRMDVTTHPTYFTQIKADHTKQGVFFIIQGIIDAQANYGVIIPVDFSFLMPRLCDDSTLEDFEEWTPKLPNNE